MRGAPTLRTTRIGVLEASARWGATLIAAVFLALGIATQWWTLVVVTPKFPSGDWVTAGFGQRAAILAWTTNPQAARYPGAIVHAISRDQTGGDDFWLPQLATTPASRQLIVPCWMIVVPSAAISVWFWARWRRLRVWAAKGCCLSCGYNRRGLDAAMPCPECGATLPSAAACASSTSQPG